MTSACSTFVVSGSILVTNAASVVRSGSTAIASGVVEIDLSAVTEADSSSLALLEIVVCSRAKLAKFNYERYSGFH